MVFLFVHLLFVLISKNKDFIYLTDKDSKDFEMRSIRPVKKVLKGLALAFARLFRGQYSNSSSNLPIIPIIPESSNTMHNCQWLAPTSISPIFLLRNSTGVVCFQTLNGNVTIGVQFIIRKSRLLQFTYLHTFFPEEFDGNDICIRVGNGFWGYAV